MATSNYLWMPNGLANQLANAFTVAAWVKPGTVAMPYQRIVSTARKNSDNGWGFGLLPATMIFTTYGVKDYYLPGVEAAVCRRAGGITWPRSLDAANAVTFYIDGVKEGTGDRATDRAGHRRHGRQPADRGLEAIGGARCYSALTRA